MTLWLLGSCGQMAPGAPGERDLITLMCFMPSNYLNCPAAVTTCVMLPIPYLMAWMEV